MTIESSRRSALAVVSKLPEIELDEVDDDGLEEPEAPHEDDSPAEIKARLIDWIDNHNIARDIAPDVLATLGQLVVREYQIDETSRAEWKDEAEKALKFAVQEAEPKQYPWPEACLSLDTDILTRSGWKPIAEVQVGEEVLSRARDGTAGYYPVLRTYRYQAREAVHFEGKSIDLLVTPNHNMLVEDRFGGGNARFVPAGEFVKTHPKGKQWPALSWTSIPLTSRADGDRPETIYGIPTKAYLRFLGWYLSEGWRQRSKSNRHVLKSGIVVDYGPVFGSFGIAQSQTANPEKSSQIESDLEACGFTWTRGTKQTSYTVHARSMPALLKQELRAMHGAASKAVPRHVLRLAPDLLEHLLETMLAGDGHVRKRSHQTQTHGTYYTISHQLADDVQEMCQRLGVRATIVMREAAAGGVINGRPITGSSQIYHVSINRKPSIQVLKLKRSLLPYSEDVACVEVAPHHTIYVRRNGKPVWVGNSAVVFPLITSAALQFNARAYPAIVQNRSVVKGVVWGDDKGTPATQDGKPDGAPKMHPDGTPVWLVPPGEKKKRAVKIGEHMSWQLLGDPGNGNDEMSEWEEQTDTLLTQMPIVGGGVRKTFRDDNEGCNKSLLVPLMNLVWNFNAPSFEKAPRHTEIQELYPHEIEELERDDERFLPIVYGPGDIQAASTDASAPAPDQSDTEAPHTFLEQHRRYDLDGDGYAEPLIVTVHLRSANVVRIVARYEEDGIVTAKAGDKIKKIKPISSYTLYRFLPNPKGGSYPVGFGHLLKPLNEAINTTINQMFDAGHLQIAGGGFIGTGLSVHAGPTNFSIGEYKPVNNKGQAIRDSIYPIPWPGPNVVLFQLLGFLVSSAKEVASIQDVLTGDAAMANASPTTLLALVEQGMKVYTAIHKRVYRALKSELAKLYRLNRIYLTEDERYRVGDTWREVTPQDYRLGGGVEPVADPSMVTDMQRITRAALVKDEAKNNPLVNPLEATRRLFDAAQIDRIDDLLPDKMPPPQPTYDQIRGQALLAKTQSDGVKQQLEMAALQSKVGLERAQEMQAYTTAMLNFAKAKSEMSQPQIAFMENQLELMRMHIEALNTTVKAAQVDAAMHRDRLHHHAAMTGHEVNHAANLADTAARARETANEQPGPADGGGGGPSGDSLDQSGGAGVEGPGLSAMAAPPGNSQLPALPSAPQPGPDAGGGGPLANG